MSSSLSANAIDEEMSIVSRKFLRTPVSKQVVLSMRESIEEVEAVSNCPQGLKMP